MLSVSETGRAIKQRKKEGQALPFRHVPHSPGFWRCLPARAPAGKIVLTIKPYAGAPGLPTRSPE